MLKRVVREWKRPWSAFAALALAVVLVVSGALPRALAQDEETVSISVIRGAMYDVMVPVAEQYTEETGIKVEVLLEPEGGAFEALIAAGNQPDAFFGSFGSMIGKYAAQDAIVPLEDMPGADEFFARFDPATVKEVYGHIYYVPMGVDVTLMIYNKALFEEAGLDPDNPPQTWDEFLAAAEAISNLPPREDGAKVYGTVFWNEALAWGGWYWNMLQPIYLNANQGECQLLNRLGTDTVIDKEECKLKEFFEFVRAAQAFAPPTMEQNFFSRTIGMWLQYGYSWEPNLLTAAGQPMVIGEDVGIAPVPVPTEGDTSFTTLGGRPIMIFKTTPERQARAWDFLQYLLRDDVNLELIKALGYLPTLTSLKDDEYFAQPARAPFVASLAHAVFPEVFVSADEVANAILPVYQQVVVEQTLTPEEGVAMAAEQAREALAKSQ